MNMTENLYAFDCTRMGHAFYLKDKQTLIDTGLPGRGRLMIRELSHIGVKPDDIKKILLTHYDVDHAGNALFFEERTPAEIFIGSGDVPCLMNRNLRPKRKRIIQKIVRAVPPKHVRPIEEPEQSGGILMYHTPGHTPGHHVFVYQDILFSGDLFRTEGDRIKTMNPKMNWNEELLMNSIFLLNEISFTVALPSHGNPITREKLLPLIGQLRSEQQ